MFRLVISETQEERLRGNLLSKLKELKLNIKITEESKEVVNKKPSFKSFSIFTKDSQFTRTVAAIGFSDEKENSFISAIDLTDGINFLSNIKNGIIEPYNKWRKVHAPNSKEYSARVVSFI